MGFSNGITAPEAADPFGIKTAVAKHQRQTEISDYAAELMAEPHQIMAYFPDQGNELLLMLLKAHATGNPDAALFALDHLEGTLHEKALDIAEGSV